MWARRTFRLIGGLLAAGLLASCSLPIPGLETPSSMLSPSAEPSPVLTAPADGGAQDARALFADVCFAFWEQQINRPFVIDGPLALIQLYNAVDDSRLCRFPVTRQDFDFAARVLVGAINVGTGCRAYTDLLDVVTDDAARTVTVRVAWGVEGECDYRLVRPFWISLPRPPEGYAVQMSFVALE